MARWAIALLGAALLSLPAMAPGQSGLVYTPDIRQRVPIPPAEKSLQTVVAEPWFKVSDKDLGLEGPAFDRQGNLYFVDPVGGTLYRLSPDKTLKTLLSDNRLGTAGVAIHKDGRLFVSGIGNVVFNDFTRAGAPHVDGSIFVVDPDGKGMKTIVPATAGYQIDDLVFDATGGFYFSDFRGSPSDPIGGVYYVSPDMQTISPVLSRLAGANGVALSPDGKTLWVTEFRRGLLHKVALAGPGQASLRNSSIAYQFTGTPDSLRVDADGNVYAAIMFQGRILVFNRDGIPIGQILLPGREAGHNLFAGSLAMKPGTNEIYVVASDFAGEGASIFRTHGFAQALSLFSHQ